MINSLSTIPSIILASLICLCISPSCFADNIEQIIISDALLASVHIQNTTKTGSRLSGSGFLLGKDGHVITNYHVILGAKELAITHYHKHIQNGSGNASAKDSVGKSAGDNIISISKTEYGPERVKIVAVDVIRDIAILKIDEIVYNDIIKPIDIVKSSSLVSGHPKFIMASNFKDHKSFVVEARLGTIGLITDIVPSRKEFAEDTESNPYEYEILLFNNVTQRGSSGSPIINLFDGTLLGIATGATGDSEYFSFGVPIKYVLELINNINKDVSGVTPANFKVTRNKRDRYYDTLATYNSSDDINFISVSGYVVEKYSKDQISNTIVKLYDKNNDSVRYTQHAGEDGKFYFTIPKNDKAKWVIKTLNTYYEVADRKDEVIGQLRDDHFMPLDLIIKEKFAIDASWLYINRSFIELNKDMGEIRIKNEFTKWKEQRKTYPDSRWSLCDKVEGCDYEKYADRIPWIYVLKSKGKIIERGSLLQLYYDSDNKKPVDTDNRADDLVIYSFHDGITEVASVTVYADQKNERSDNYLQGFVTFDAGGVPEQGMIEMFAKFVDKNDNSNIRNRIPIDIIDDDGYFQYIWPSTKTSDNTNLILDIISEVYRNKDDKDIVINQSETYQPLVIIKLLPKQ